MTGLVATGPDRLSAYDAYPSQAVPGATPPSSVAPHWGVTPDIMSGHGPYPAFIPGAFYPSQPSSGLTAAVPDL